MVKAVALLAPFVAHAVDMDDSSLLQRQVRGHKAETWEASCAGWYKGTTMLTQNRGGGNSQVDADWKPADGPCTERDGGYVKCSLSECQERCDTSETWLPGKEKCNMINYVESKGRCALYTHAGVPEDPPTCWKNKKTQSYHRSAPATAAVAVDILDLGNQVNGCAASAAQTIELLPVEVEKPEAIAIACDGLEMAAAAKSQLADAAVAKAAETGNDEDKSQAAECKEAAAAAKQALADKLKESDDTDDQEEAEEVQEEAEACAADAESMRPEGDAHKVKLRGQHTAFLPAETCPAGTYGWGTAQAGLPLRPSACCCEAFCCWDRCLLETPPTSCLAGWMEGQVAAAEWKWKETATDAGLGGALGGMTHSIDADGNWKRATGYYEAVIPHDSSKENCRSSCWFGMRRWDEKCRWGEEYCRGCRQCKEVSNRDRCETRCHFGKLSWDDKCKRVNQECSGCKQCKEPETRKVCKSSCHFGKATWAEKCARATQECAACRQCN